MSDAATATVVPAVPATTADAGAAPATAGRSRLAGIEALRGVAALAVVASHLGDAFALPLKTSVRHWFDPGMFGVVLFFLISGYLVPAALDRSGPAAFWTGRLFRLYPAYAVAILGAVLLDRTGLHRLDPALGAHPVGTVAGHATMLQHLLGGPVVLGVFWTLSFEMAFYLIVTALHATRTGRATTPLAFGFAATALGAATLGQHPLRVLGPGATVPVAIGMVAALIGATSRRPALRYPAAAVLAGIGVTCGLQYPIDPYQGATLMAVLFLGAATQRLRHQPHRLLVLAAAGTETILLIGIIGQERTPNGHPVAWCVTMAAVGVAFAAGLLLPARRIPGLLVRIGTVSYSLYLLHGLVIHAIHGATSSVHAPLARLGLATASTAAALALATVSYHRIEEPAQRLGRRIRS